MGEKMTFDEFLSSSEFVEMYKHTMEAGKNAMQAKYEQLNEFAQKGMTVFAGDSIMEYFPVHELLGGGIYDRGVGGDTSGEMLARLPAIVLPLNPSKVFIMVGTNDIQAGVGTDATIHNLKEAFRLLHENGRSNGTDTRIYLLSVIPVNERGEGDAVSGVGIRTNAAIRRLNERYEALCKECGCEFVNVYPLLERDGSLPDEFSADGLHPNIKGYLPICDEIRKHLWN